MTSTQCLTTSPKTGTEQPKSPKPGSNQKAPINRGPELDFTGLFSEDTEKKPAAAPETAQDGPEQERPQTTPEANEANTSRCNSEIKPAAAPLIRRQREKAADQERSLEICQTYQENARRSEELQSRILKGIPAGENIYSLFLDACRAISLMTSDGLFYEQARADIAAIYGDGLQEPEPLKIELREAEVRLAKLQEAEQKAPDYDTLDRIRRAIRAHRQTIADIQAQLQRA